MKALFLVLFSCLAACAPSATSTELASRSEVAADTPPLGAIRVELWATRYYTLALSASDHPKAIPLRDMQDRVIGPSLTPADWCAAAMEGTVAVSDEVYNYAGAKTPEQTRCQHRPSGQVRWMRSPFETGVGSQDNRLDPFHTLACDFGTVPKSTPWLNGGYPRFGQKIYIPAAKGVSLPDGTVHDGVFTCADQGSLITGHHVDVYLGLAQSAADAARIDPFPFIQSTPLEPFVAYVLRE